MSRGNTPFFHYDPAVEHLAKTLKLAKETGASAELTQSIQETFDLCMRREQFAQQTTSDQSETCAQIIAETLSHDWQKAYDEKKTTWHCKPFIMTGHLEGQFLKSVISAQKAKKVLDVGMFTGYSALSIAEVLPADGKIVSLDMEEYLKQLVEKLTQTSPHKDKIHIIIGKALESMTKLQQDGEYFDVIFLDADKSEYEQYLKLCLENNLLAPGGTIIVDNAFWHGYSYKDPSSTSAKFGALIKNNKDLHVVLVPLRDGIYLVRRRVDVEGGVA